MCWVRGVLGSPHTDAPSLGVGVLWKPLAASSTRVTAELTALPTTALQGEKPRPRGADWAREKRSVSECRRRGGSRRAAGAVPCLPEGLHRPCPGSLQLLQPHWVPRSRTSRLKATQRPPAGVDHRRVRARAQGQMIWGELPSSSGPPFPGLLKGCDSPLRLKQENEDALEHGLPLGM